MVFRKLTAGNISLAGFRECHQNAISPLSLFLHNIYCLPFPASIITVTKITVVFSGGAEGAEGMVSAYLVSIFRLTSQSLSLVRYTFGTNFKQPQLEKQDIHLSQSVLVCFDGDIHIPMSAPCNRNGENAEKIRGFNRNWFDIEDLS